MGYESKIIIAEKHEAHQQISFNGKTLDYASVIAIYNLSRIKYPSPVADLIDASPEADCYFYFDGDGDHEVCEDRYGKPLVEINILDLSQALKYESDPHRRFLPFANLLDSFLKNDSFNNVVALHYGY